MALISSTGSTQYALHANKSTDNVAWGKPANISVLTAMTAMIWCKRQWYMPGAGNWAGMDMKLISKRDAVGRGFAMRVRNFPDATLAVLLGDNAGHSFGVTTTTSYTTGNDWKRIGWTFDGDKTRMYVNGVNVKTSGSTPYVIDSSLDNLYDNQYGSSGSNQSFDGDCYGMMIYSRALSDAEMLADYLGQAVSTTSLQLNCQMQEGTGNTVNDTSGNGYNGTITGKTWATRVLQTNQIQSITF